MSFAVVLLAGGKGVRMGVEKPKALIELSGKALIQYSLEVIHEARVADELVIVVGYRASEVIEYLGENYFFIRQLQQRGTGHAVQCALPVLSPGIENVMVVYSDHPTIRVSTLRRMRESHERSGAILTMGTVQVPHFCDWYWSFYSFGRVVRNNDGKVCRIVELIDAEKDIENGKEVNPSYFCFRRSWLEANIGRLQADNKKGEIYLTDMVKIACSDGASIDDFPVDPREALGVNTPEELVLAEQVLLAQAYDG